MLFSPSYAQVAPRELADWIVADRLPVRFQMQLHKLLWNDEPGAEPRSISASDRIDLSAAMKNAVVLVSGGMDSAVVLAIAREQGFDCHALSVRYGQRHTSELDAADRVSRALGAVAHKTVNVDLRSIGGSALTDDIDVPPTTTGGTRGRRIPVTYVPARNTIMLSVALGWAEVLGADRPVLRRQRGRLLRLSGLPPGIHRRLREPRQPRDQGRRRRRRPPRARAAACA